MPLTKCARCKKLFNKIELPVCRDCQADEEADQEKVRKLLEEHPNVSAEEASEMSGVDVECILRMLDSGRLTNTTMFQGVTCGRCGAPAISFAKRLCNACLDKLNAEIAKEQMSVKLPEKREARIGSHGSTGGIRQTLEQKRRR